MALDPAREFAKFYSQWEKDLQSALRKAARDASKAVAGSGATGLGQVRQRIGSRAIDNALNELGAGTFEALRTGRSDAARLAATVLADADLEVFRSLGMSADDAAYYLRAEQLRAVAAIETAARRVTTTSIPLSQQVYRTTALQKGMVDRAVTAGLARGLNARDLAKSVRSMINPDTPGGVSFASKRLARTEINNAYHATTKAQMKAKPWTRAVKWNLSGSHPRTDICNEYAETEWTVDNVPDKPHPQCLCYITAVPISDEQFIDEFIEGRYDDYIDDIMDQSGYTSELSSAIRLPPKQSGGVRPPSKSKDPLVRQKVADLDDEQYLRWMTKDTRPVAQKMTDPYYNVKPRVPTSTPPVPTPTATPTATAARTPVTATGNAVKGKPTALSEMRSRQLGGSVDGDGWEVVGNKIVVQSEEGRQAAIRLAKDIRDINKDNLYDDIYTGAERAYMKRVAGNMQELIDDLEKMAVQQADDVAVKVATSAPTAQNVSSTIAKEFPDIPKWKTSKARTTHRGELVQSADPNPNGYYKVTKTFDDNVEIDIGPPQYGDRAVRFATRDKWADDIAARYEALGYDVERRELAGRVTLKIKPKKVTAIVDELPAAGYTPIERKAVAHARELQQVGQGSGSLTRGEKLAVDRARQKWIRAQRKPRGNEYNTYFELNRYYEQQFDIRFLNHTVKDGKITEHLSPTMRASGDVMPDPWDDVIKDAHAFESKIHKDVDDMRLTNTGMDVAQARAAIDEFTQEVYDLMEPGQLGATRSMLVSRETIYKSHPGGASADASMGYVVRISDETASSLKKKWSGLDEGRAPSQDNGWVAQTGDDVSWLRYTVHHEYGHITDYGFTVAERTEAFGRVADAIGLPRPIVKAADSWAKQKEELTAWVKKNEDVLRKEISRYGTTDSWETIAELFAEVTLNPYPRAAAQAYKDYLIEIGRLKP